MSIRKRILSASLSPAMWLMPHCGMSFIIRTDKILSRACDTDPGLQGAIAAQIDILSRRDRDARGRPGWRLTRSEARRMSATAILMPGCTPTIVAMVERVFEREVAASDEFGRLLVAQTQGVRALRSARQAQ